MKSKSHLSINEFEFIYVEKDDQNITELLLFCGVKQEDIEQELIFHTEGDPFHYSEFRTLDDAIGSYLIKHKDDIFQMPEHTFKILFNVQAEVELPA